MAGPGEFNEPGTELNPGSGLNNETSDTSPESSEVTTSETPVYPFTVGDKNLIDYDTFKLALVSRSNTVLKNNCLYRPTFSSSWLDWYTNFRISNNELILNSGLGNVAFVHSPSDNSLPAWGRNIDVYGGAFKYKGVPPNFTTIDNCPIPFSPTSRKEYSLFEPLKIFTRSNPNIFFCKKDNQLYYYQTALQTPPSSLSEWTLLKLNPTIDFNCFFICLQGAGGISTAVADMSPGAGGGGAVIALVSLAAIPTTTTDTVPVGLTKLYIGKHGDANNSDGENTTMEFPSYLITLQADGGKSNITQQGGSGRIEVLTPLPVEGLVKIVSVIAGGNGGNGNSVDGQNITNSSIDLSILASGKASLRAVGDLKYGYGGKAYFDSGTSRFGCGGGGALCGYSSRDGGVFHIAGYGAGGGGNNYTSALDGCAIIFAATTTDIG